MAMLPSPAPEPIAAPPLPRADRWPRGLWWINGAVGVFSLVQSGMTFVVPQVFFRQHAGEMALASLSGCLFLGGVLAVAAVALAPRGGRAGLMAGTATVGLAGACALFAPSAWVFVPAYALSAFAANYMVAALDARGCALAGEAWRGANDRLNNASRLLGFLLGPLAYGALSGQPGWMLGLLALGMAAAAVASRVEAPPPAAAAAGTPAGGLDRTDRLLIGHAVSVYGAYYALASSMTYLLGDYLGLADAPAKAGVVIMTVYVGALLALATGSRLPMLREPAPGAVAIAPLALPSLLLAAAMALYQLRVVADFVPTVLAAVALGAAYGGFLHALRGHVTREVARGKAGFLMIFNNLSNASALLAYGLMVAVSGLGRGAGLWPLLAAIQGLAFLGLALLFAASRRRHP